MLKSDFKEFGSKFQITLLKLFLIDEPFTNNMRNILREEYFDNKMLRFFFNVSIKYLNKYNNFPSFDVFYDYINRTIEDEIEGGNKNIYRIYFDKIKNADLTSRKYVIEESLNFCRIKHAIKLNETQKEELERGNINKARELSFSAYSDISDVKKITYLKKDYKEAVKKKHYNAMPTLFNTYNINMQGGPGAGDLAVVVAQSSFGKTAYLIALARSIIKRGGNVLYFTLETRSEQLINRALSGLVKLQQDKLEEELIHIEKVVNKLEGEIKFIRYKSTFAFVSSLIVDTEESKASGFFPDIIIVDGLNQLKLPPDKKYLNNNSNDKFEYLAEQLRDMASDFEIPLWCSFQSNRGAFNKSYADEQNIGKAIEVYQVADIMLLFTQTVKMQEKDEAYVQLLKNRLGKKGITLKIFYDPALSIFREEKVISRSDLAKEQRGEVIEKIKFENNKTNRNEYDEKNAPY